MGNMRNRDWESDILFFTKTVLTQHPYMLDWNVHVIHKEYYISSNSSNAITQDTFYDEDLRALFIAKSEELMASIPKLSDNELMLELMGLITFLRDMHTKLEVNFSHEQILPFTFHAFYDGIYCCSTIAKFKRVIGCTLKRINGKDVGEILKISSNIYPSENIH